MRDEDWYNLFYGGWKNNRCDKEDVSSLFALVSMFSRVRDGWIEKNEKVVWAQNLFCEVIGESAHQTGDCMVLVGRL